MSYWIYKNRGAVSIFLVIVLVPMLLASSIFVDLSRITLANAVVQSSGDLALNTALTNYDAVLKEMYGLFATAQDTDEMFENLEEYYRKCIESAGLDEIDADNYVDQIMQFVKSAGGNDDILNMDLVTFDVVKPTAGNLQNPAILKTQIVEFMKYRAPISLGAGLFDALGALKNMKKQTKLVEDKTNFYEKQTDLLEELESLWKDIENYQFSDAYLWFENTTQAGFPSGDGLKYYIDYVNYTKDEVKKTLAYNAAYVYPASFGYPNTDLFAGMGVTISVYPNSAGTLVGKCTVNTGSNDEPYEVDEKPAESTVQNLIDAAKVIKTAYLNVSGDYDVKRFMRPNETNISDSEKIYVLSKVAKASDLSRYNSSIHTYVECLVNLINVYQGLGEDEDISNYYYVHLKDSNNSETYEFLTQEELDTTEKTVVEKTSLDSYVNSYMSKLNINDTYISGFNSDVRAMSQYWADTHSLVETARNKVSFYFSDMVYRLESFKTFLDNKMGKIDDAIGKITNISSQLSDPNSEYNKALSDWKASANELAGETMGDNDLAEIDKLDDVLTATELSKLKTRLEAAKTSLAGVSSAIQSYSVMGKKFLDMGASEDVDYEDALSQLKTSYGSRLQSAYESAIFSSSRSAPETLSMNTVSGTYNKSMQTLINEIKDSLLIPSSIKHEWGVGEESKSPDLQKNQTKIYTWLYNNFCDMDDVKDAYDNGDELTSSDGVADNAGAGTEISDSEDKINENANKIENSAEDPNKKVNTGTVASNSFKGVSNIPSIEWGGTLKDLALEVTASKNSDSMLSQSDKGLGKLDELFDQLATMTTDFRDNMYVANYIMNMFSYATFEAEIAAEHGFDGIKNAFKNWYTYDESTKTYVLSSDFNSTYGVEAGRAMLEDAKTLTKVPIDPNLNYLYGKEIEYIAFGNADNPSTPVFATIYLIRLALNTVYAFTDAEINSITTAAATALFGVPPLTPLIPIAKVAMIVGISLAESAYDIIKMKAGQEVPLIKNSKTWVMKPSNAAAELVTQVTDTVVDAGTNMLTNVLNATSEELDEMIAQGQLKVDEMADAAIEGTVSEMQNIANQAVNQLVTICTDIRNEATEQEGMAYTIGQTAEKISTATDRLNEWLNNSSGDSEVVALAKKTAVDFLTENGGAKIGEIIDTIENVDQVAAEYLSGEIQEVLLNVQGELGSLVDKLTDQAGNALSDLKGKLEDQISSAIKEGGDKLKSVLSEQIGTVFGSSSNGQQSTSNVVNALLMWSYRDYLQVFVIVAVLASPESVILRTADIIEANVDQAKKNPTVLGEHSSAYDAEPSTTKFDMGKAYTYLGITTTVHVKPLMIGLPIFGDTATSQLDGTKWYQITYDGKGGY